MPNPLSPLTPLGASCEAYFRAALQQELGYIVGSNSSFRARNTLYKYRSENPNPEYDTISILISPDNPETDLWLIRQGVEQVEL